MKRQLVFTTGLLFTLFTHAAAQLEIKKTEQNYPLSVPFSKFNNISHNNIHGNKTFKTKYTSTSVAPIVTKLPYDAPKIYINNTKNSFYSKTFDTDEDGGGIDLKLAERTSINLGLGCYEGSDKYATNDTCDQSPDLDMSISLVFDLK